MADSPLGGSVNRVDGRLKVTGGAKYAADYQADRVCYGYLLLSSIAKGSIASMDTAHALASVGVLAVYTPFNSLPLNTPRGAGPNWVPLQDNVIRHYGQIIGLVVAETFEQAVLAATLVQITYAPAAGAVSFVDGIPNATAQPPTDILADGVVSIDDALAASEVTISGTYQQRPKHHNAMEPHAMLAVWDADHLTAYSGTQAPISHASNIATALGIDRSLVHVVSQHVGGGFGNKASTWTHDLVAAAAARAIGRPIKLVLTRAQTFSITGHRSAVQQTVTLGASRDGTLTALKHDAWSSLSASGWTFESAPGSTSRFLYQTQNLHVGQNVVTLDWPPSTVMRAPGEESGSFAIESAMDELADALRIDPVALRLKNYATTYPGRGVPWSSKHLDECYQVGMDKFGWALRNPVPRSVVDGDWLVGLGMSTAVYPASHLSTTVRVRLQADGTATIASATADLGTGMWTVLAIFGADGLGIPLDRIKPDLGDSTLPNNTGAFGSTSTASVSGAAVNATTSAKQALIQLAVTNDASPFFGLDPASLSYQDGAVVGAGKSVAFADLLAATGTATVEGTGNDAGGDATQWAFHSFGAHFVEVRVNRFTGEPRLSRITTVIDAGKIVNQKAARSQIIGGVIFGIGHAMTEGALVEPGTGRIANTNLMDYMLPVHLDVPPIDVTFLDHPDTVFNPVGVRGIGELGTVGSGAAIANAVFNATGVRIRELPITLDKLLTM